MNAAKLPVDGSVEGHHRLAGCELLPEPNARPVCVLRVNFNADWDPLIQMASAAGSTGANSSKLTRARGYSARPWRPRAVFSADTLDPCASRTAGVDVLRT